MSDAASSSLHSRRGFLRLAAGSAAASLIACSGKPSMPGQPLAAAAPAEAVAGAMSSSGATPTPTEPPVPEAGHLETSMMTGTEWETPLYITHSGVRGPVVLVLGGVHGNEPGGWFAAEEVAYWQPHAGSLIVIPRANRLATHMLERTTMELGDLNRLYPGSPDGQPMARMAHSIIELAREHRVNYVVDMHESWMFFAERTQNGTAFLGQTIAAGEGPETSGLAEMLCARVNEQLGNGSRDRLWTRDQLPIPGSTPVPSNGNPGGARGGRGSSSLAIGRHVAGVTPLLVEMGQYNQRESRRVELHMLVARALLESRGML